MNKTHQGPVAIGVILDGNRRWAKAQGLSGLEGHKAGMEKVESLVKWAGAAGIKEVTIYAFSTENWNRSQEEVAYLMELFETAFDTAFKEIKEQGGRIRFIGQRERLSTSLQEKISLLEKETEKGTGTLLVVALSYGGRAELVAGVNRLLASGASHIQEQDLRDALWTHGLAEPDLIIRTGGDKRLSNFLTWQSVYSELFFTDTPWPAFSEEEFRAILQEFTDRERRHGR